MKCNCNCRGYEHAFRARYGAGVEVHCEGCAALAPDPLQVADRLATYAAEYRRLHGPRKTFLAEKLDEALVEYQAIRKGQNG